MDGKAFRRPGGKMHLESLKTLNPARDTSRYADVVGLRLVQDLPVCRNDACVHRHADRQTGRVVSPHHAGNHESFAIRPCITPGNLDFPGRVVLDSRRSSICEALARGPAAAEQHGKRKTSYRMSHNPTESSHRTTSPHELPPSTPRRAELAASGLSRPMNPYDSRFRGRSHAIPGPDKKRAKFAKPT